MLYYPVSDNFTVGDTIIIVYEEETPDHNKPIRGYNQLSEIIKDNKSVKRCATYNNPRRL